MSGSNSCSETAKPALPNRLKLAADLGSGGHGVAGEAPKLTLQDGIHLSRGKVGEEGLARGRAMDRQTLTHRRRNLDPLIGVDHLKVDDMTAIQRCQIDGLAAFTGQGLQVGFGPALQVDIAQDQGRQLDQPNSGTVAPVSASR